MALVTSVVIVGGGPGGYEAALVAAQLGATVTVVDRDGLGGSAVLTDCVPSKALISVASVMAQAGAGGALGVRDGSGPLRSSALSVDLAQVNARITALAQAQSDDIEERLGRDGIRVIHGTGRIVDAQTVHVNERSGAERMVEADVVLLATGARPRTLAGAEPDGDRILTWEQLYGLTELPERLIVVGSGVTGAEFASAYRELGSDVVLVSSRDHVLPGEDTDAARVIEDVFASRGMTVMGRSRAAAAVRHGEGVRVTLDDGRTVDGSHCLMAVGSIPNTDDLGLDAAGVRLTESGHIEVDRVSRTSVRGVYAAGDCTGVLMLASVAAMQGRIAMWHALGDAVAPLDVGAVSSAVFTDPEIATVGATQRDLDEGRIRAIALLLPLATNARAKMLGLEHGFVKLFARSGTRIVVGGVVVAPRASELIHSIALAVDQRLTVDQLALTFTVYPSLSGSIAEAARRLHVMGTESAVASE
ncbi:MAG: NAD(P)H-quinone dehydrogenase [Actinomycetes bacterium]